MSRTDEILTSGTPAERAALFAEWPKVTDGDVFLCGPCGETLPADADHNCPSDPLMGGKPS